MLRQGLEGWPLLSNGPALPSVDLTDHLVQKTLIRCQVGKIVAAAQQQRLFDPAFQMPVGRFDRPVLMALPAIVAAGLHPEVGTQGLVTGRHVLALVARQVLERRRQRIGPMFPRVAAQTPQGLLQTFGQRREALAAQYHHHVAKAAEDHPEVIQQVR